MSEPQHFVLVVGPQNTALGKVCSLCGERFQAGDVITLALCPARSASPLGVHTACLGPGASPA